MNYLIRPATREELKIPLEWAAKEDWNPGIYDLDSFYATDPKGYFLGFLNGDPIASLSAVSYGNSFGFLGFYIVKPEYRGNGYGLKIWKEALQHLPVQNIGLDGVIAQQENYKKSGFKRAYNDIRFEGKGIQKNSKNDNNIVPLSKVPFDQLQKYDDQIFPANRQIFLKHWLQQPDSLAIGMIKNGELTGYGMVRKCRKGFKVGPLFVDHKNIAELLFQKMLTFVGKDESIFLDVPEVNEKAIHLAESYSMKPVFETARMYTKEFPEVPIHKVFGVTTFELG